MTSQFYLSKITKLNSEGACLDKQVLTSYPSGDNSFFFLRQQSNSRIQIAYAVAVKNIPKYALSNDREAKYIIVSEIYSLGQNEPLMPDPNGLKFYHRNPFVQQVSTVDLNWT